uniref:G-protein coupled receptors family 1 profile domain-containing protein n=1 Tax=Trichogramma kaykai TaxID=54128 RepID=A0ABD2XHM2_9HYME
MAESEDTSLLLRRLMVLGGGHHYTEADHRSNLLKDYPPWLLTFAAACCVLFMLVGIPGNLLTLFALFRTKKFKNATAVFIMNLSLSDLMFCCVVLPLAASMFWHGVWRHGPFFCQLFPFLRYALVAVSLFTVLSITINRYVMIGHPRLYPKIYTPRNLLCMVLSTWVGGFGALLPTTFGVWGRFGLDPAIGSCSILPDANGRTPKISLFVLAFVAPCLSIVVCYARIFHIVRRTALKSRRRDAEQQQQQQQQQRRDATNVAPAVIAKTELATEKTITLGRSRRKSGSALSCQLTTASHTHDTAQTTTSLCEAISAQSCPPKIETRRFSLARLVGSLQQQQQGTMTTSNSNYLEATTTSTHETASAASSSCDVVLPELRIQDNDNFTKSLQDFPYIDVPQQPQQQHVQSRNDSGLILDSSSLPAAVDLSSRFLSPPITYRYEDTSDDCASSRSDSPSASDRPSHRRFSSASSYNNPCNGGGDGGAAGGDPNHTNTNCTADDKKSSDAAAAVIISIAGVDHRHHHNHHRHHHNHRNRRHHKRRRSRFPSFRRGHNNSSDGTGKMTAKDKKLLKMILVIFTAFLVCYLPITISKTFKLNILEWRGLNIAGYILIYLTTCINPVIYVVMSSEYRHAYKNMLLCRKDHDSRGERTQRRRRRRQAAHRHSARK